MKKIITDKNIILLPILNIVNLCSMLSEVEFSFRNLIKNIPSSYREIYITKPDGTKRRLDTPDKNLKGLQRKVLDFYLNRISLPKYVYGIGKKKTIIENANVHLNSNELLTIDIKSFFPNIHYKRVEALFTDIGCENEVAKVLTQITTLNYSLPQGAPTSPYIASVVLSNLDIRIFKLCKAMRLTYTRYFDDIFISGHFISQELKLDFLKIIEEEGYDYKVEKIHHYKKGEKKYMTGLVIQDKKLSIDNMKEISEYLKKIKKDGLSALVSDNPEKQKLILQGKINFISSVDPIYGKRLKKLFQLIEW